MRVAILGKDFPPVTGGIADHTEHLATALARVGHDVTVVCSPPADPVHGIAVDASISSWHPGSYASIVEAVARSRPDAIVWQYNPFAVGRRGLAPRIGRLAKGLSVVSPLVVLAHELWFPWGREGARGAVWAVAQRAETLAVLRHSARFVVTTEQRAHELRDHARVRVVPIGANVEPPAAPVEPTLFASVEREETRARLGLAPDAFVVAHFGSVGPGRDLAPVLRALATLRSGGLDARLLLVGAAGPFDPPPAVSDAITVTGVMPRDHVSSALSASDVYVHPDRSGPAVGRRGSLAAALAHALPVVAFKGPDAAPQLIDGVSVVQVEPGSLAGALRALAEDPLEARSIGEAGRKVYATWFAWDVIGARMTEVLGEVAG